MGKDALIQRQSRGVSKKLISLQVHATHAPAHPGASLMEADTVVGTITSGDWGHRVGMNLAYAFVDSKYATEGQKVRLDLCGDLIDATVIPPSPYDPEFAKLRAS